MAHGGIRIAGEVFLKKPSIQGIEYLQMSAKQGDLTALENLGKCYENGWDVERWPEMAFYLYKLAADIGLKNGRNITPVYILKKRESVSNYAKAKKFEIEGGKSLEKAIHQYILAGEKELSTGYYRAGLCYKQMGEEFAREAVDCFRMGAAQNNALALLALAEAFKEGYGVEKSETEAQYYYQLAWDHAPVNLELRRMAADKEIFEYRQIAAQKREPESQFFLGIFYRNVVGNRQSDEKAFKYLKLAADQGYPYALLGVADCYESGRGIVQSEEEALKYYKLAEEKGYQKEAV